MEEKEKERGREYIIVTRHMKTINTGLCPSTTTVPTSWEHQIKVLLKRVDKGKGEWRTFSISHVTAIPSGPSRPHASAFITISKTYIPDTTS